MTAPTNLGALRDRFCDVLEVHPMQDWPPDLLQAVLSVVELYVSHAGLQQRPAEVLQLVRNRLD